MYCFETSQYTSTKINYIALVTFIYFMILVHVRFTIANCTCPVKQTFKYTGVCRLEYDVNVINKCFLTET